MDQNQSRGALEDSEEMQENVLELGGRKSQRFFSFFHFQDESRHQNYE